MNWQKIVAELKQTGLTQAQIAKAINVSDSTLSELCSGKTSEIRWTKGNALVTLHAEVCGAQQAA